MSRPDIVLLVLDTQRADRLSCYGCPVETSPYLDALAAKATQFAHAVAPAQWTIPSHASMFTGLYPSQHATTQLDSALPRALPTLAERLSRSGYATAAFSNNPLVGVLNNGLRRGFDTFSNYGGLLTLRPPDDDRSRQGTFRRRLARLLRRIQQRLAHSHALRAIWFAPPIVPLWLMALRLKGNLKGDTRRALGDAARLLVERRGLAADQPVFCFINLMGTHVPFDPPDWALDRFVPRALRPANRLPLWRFNAEIFAALGPLEAQLNPERKALLDGLYNAEVAAQDRQLGAFFARLRAAGALDRTLLIVVADHGEHLGEKQLLGHAFAAYEDLLHVPLLIRDPLGDLPDCKQITPCVSARRVYHTILAAAGAATPDEELLTLAQTNQQASDKDLVFAEAIPLRSALQLLEGRRPDLLRAFGYDQSRTAIYRGAYKLILTGEDRVELYAIRDDPTESRDVQPAQAGSASNASGARHAPRSRRSGSLRTTSLLSSD
jgi:arylsulfatase A-like enzyme